MSDTYKIVFRGDIAPGHTLVEVKSRLAGMFRLDEESVAKLFSGRPVTIKRNLNGVDAKTWCDTLRKAGAVAQAVAESESAPSASVSSTEAPALDDGLRVEPVGADVLRPSERVENPPLQVETDHLSLDAVGADILRPHERRVVKAPVLDLSHLRVETP